MRRGVLFYANQIFGDDFTVSRQAQEIHTSRHAPRVRIFAIPTKMMFSCEKCRSVVQKSDQATINAVYRCSNIVQVLITLEPEFGPRNKWIRTGQRHTEAISRC